MKVLGIETSCDETGVALYDSKKGLLAHVLYSQADMHAQFGGVVPELASRDHIRKTLPLIEQVLEESQVSPKELNGIAYTAGPGLAGALLVGAAIGRSYAFGLGIPAVAVHHMEGHLLAPMLEDKKPEFPFLALLVSGGHTQLLLVKTLGDYTLLGDTLDDAVGEAFDKTAKLLGLGYPGGAPLSKLAQQGTPHRFTFPRPMTDRPGLDFSFSGLKTFALNTITKESDDEQTKADIAWAFQEAVVETLYIKCRRAMESTGVKTLVLAGGVSANTRLREKFHEFEISHNAKLFYPRLEFCTDNGAMIAYVGYLRLKAGESTDLAIRVNPRWSLGEDKLFKCF